ncbi:MFS transporter [Pontibacter harenae]|uniref:MFS transporter n=1 Tax=Pontibacter harenae TaxID=2894083 RepID=UPI001E4A39AA|nr:MFS transporter [Pontibacter harenae]MCC9167059.1 MFS transporter [Pontibacter harenae]
MLTDTTSTAYSKRITRIAVGAMFFLQGMSFASWGSRIPTIQQALGLSEAALGGVLFSLPVGLMVSLPLSGWLVTKIGSKRVVVLSLLTYSLILATIGFAQSATQLIVALFFFGLAGNMVNIAINTQAVGVEEMYKKPIMASFHGLWSLAGFTGAAIGTFMIGLGIVPFQHFIGITIFTFVFVAIASRYILSEDIKTGEEQRVFVMPTKSLLTLGLIAFCSMVCEGAMFDWSGVYFKKVLQVENAWVGAGYTAFMCAMASTRFVADWLTGKFGLKRVLQASGILTLVGLVIAVALPYLLPATIGFLLVGAGVSSVVPLVYSAAGKTTTMSPGAAIAAVSTISFFGFLIGPPMIGLIAGATSLRVSLSVIAVLGFCVTVISTRTKSI